MAIGRGSTFDFSAPAVLGLPRSAYVHVPFCRHRCGYCNFSVLAGRDDLADAFLNALQAELEMLESPKRVDTLFIGGGTPTHLDCQWLEKFLTLVLEWFPLSDAAAEFTVEANPNDLSNEKLELLQRQGVNRISLGVQSFNPVKLATLERTHSPEQAVAAIEMAAESIGNVSIDLIFAAPGETPDDWQRDLKIAIALPLTHLSSYGLTFEKGTRFWSRVKQSDLKTVTEDFELAMYDDAISILSQAGFQHYEVSNFARSQYQCRHNMSYWRGVGWYAAGPGAASFVDGRREVRHRSATTYINRLLHGESPINECETLTQEQLIRERTAFGLRMLAGIDLCDVGPLPVVETLLGQQLQMLIEIGMIKRTESVIALTRQGLLVSDSVLSEIL